MEQRDEQPSKVGRLTARLTQQTRLTQQDQAIASPSALNDGFTGAFELAMTPAILALIGFGIDRWLGTTPLATVVLAVLGLVGVVARLYFGYQHEMDGLQAARTAKSPTPDRDSTAEAVASGTGATV